jgi:uncharacterized protein
VNGIAHFEMQVADTQRTIEFYKNVFGWKIEKFGDMGYSLITIDGEKVGGGILHSPDGQARVVNTIEVDSVDDYLIKINNNGGETIHPKMKIPGRGWVAYCQGPEGLTFGIFQPDEK